MSRRRTTSVFLAATAATALHVLDDATLHREPGTRIADHLTGAGALLAVLAVAALLVPRLRAGAQASLALFVGALAATLGVLQLVDPGASLAADASALLSVAAALVALALGVMLLWTSRRGGRPIRRYGRRTLLGIGALVVGYYVVFPTLFAVGIPHQPRKTFEAVDLGRPYEDVRLRTSDGLVLAGWYVPSRNGAAVIAFPGRIDPIEHARFLVRHGFGVLLVDMRGTGKSQGDPNAFGWGAGRDVEAAIDFLSRRPDVRPGAIGGLGLSVGGELMLQTAATDRRLAAVVSEGAGYRTLHEQLELGAVSSWLNAPQGVVLFGVLRAVAPAPPPKPLDELVPRISPRPVLFIEAGHGQGGEELTSLYYRRAGQPKSLWRIPESQHIGGLTARPAEYERRVVAFFDAALLHSTSS